MIGECREIGPIRDANSHWESPSPLPESVLPIFGIVFIEKSTTSARPKPIDLLAATYSTSPFAQIVNLGLFALTPFLVAWVIFSAQTERLLFLLAWFGLCSVGWNHLTPAAYPIVPVLPLTIAALAALAAQGYATRPGLWRLSAYAVLSFAAFFQYEPATVVNAILLVWFLRHRVRESNRRRNLYVATGIALAVYGAVYIAWRMLHPDDGYGSLGSLSPLAVGRVLVYYALGALPLPHLVEGLRPVLLGDPTIGMRTLSHPGMSARVLWSGIGWVDVIAAGASAVLLWVLLRVRADQAAAGASTATNRARSIAGGREVDARADTTASLSRQFWLGLLFLVGANLLLAVNQKYQGWVAGHSMAYLTSYYALFGWAVLAGIAMRAIGSRWWAAAAAVAAAAAFIGTSAYNHAAASQIRANFSRWQAVAALAACHDHLRAFHRFAMPAVFQSTGSMMAVNWSTYWREWTTAAFGRPLRIVADDDAAGSGATATFRPVLGDSGQLKALVGSQSMAPDDRGEARAFVIYRDAPPNFVRIRQPAADSDPRADWHGDRLFPIGELAVARCEGGYRMASLNGLRAGDQVEVSWGFPDVLAGLQRDQTRLIVADSEVESAVEALFLGFFKRAVDPGGLDFYARKLRRWNANPAGLAKELASSPEYRQRFDSGEFGAEPEAHYLWLAGRPPRADELARLNALRSRSDFAFMLPWFVVDDLFRARDPVFLNRLELAREYTRSAYPAHAWRANVWTEAARNVSEDRESVARAAATWRQ